MPFCEPSDARSTARVRPGTSLVIVRTTAQGAPTQSVPHARPNLRCLLPRIPPVARDAFLRIRDDKGGLAGGVATHARQVVIRSSRVDVHLLPGIHLQKVRVGWQPAFAAGSFVERAAVAAVLGIALGQRAPVAILALVQPLAVQVVLQIAVVVHIQLEARALQMARPTSTRRSLWMRLGVGHVRDAMRVAVLLLRVRDDRFARAHLLRPLERVEVHVLPRRVRLVRVATAARLAMRDASRVALADRVVALALDTSQVCTPKRQHAPPRHVVDAHTPVCGVDEGGALARRELDVLEAVVDVDGPSHAHLQAPAEEPVLVVQRRLLEASPQKDLVTVERLQIVDALHDSVGLGEQLDGGGGEDHDAADDDVDELGHLQGEDLGCASLELVAHTPVAKSRAVERTFLRVAKLQVVEK
mmetsp:Transcript_9074/g.19738  ORF Transcript_9074/g.19738 Transcript_9074/m.19738 type:complete len:415 (-) Transcript_9074:1088-2332(-)